MSRREEEDEERRQAERKKEEKRKHGAERGEHTWASCLSQVQGGYKGARHVYSRDVQVHAATGEARRYESSGAQCEPAARVFIIRAGRNKAHGQRQGDKEPPPH